MHDRFFATQRPRPAAQPSPSQTPVSQSAALSHAAPTAASALAGGGALLVLPPPAGGAVLSTGGAPPTSGAASGVTSSGRGGGGSGRGGGDADTDGASPGGIAVGGGSHPTTKAPADTSTIERDSILVTTRILHRLDGASRPADPHRMLRLCAAALSMAVVCGAGCNDEEADGPPEATTTPAPTPAAAKTSDATTATASQPEVKLGPPTYPDSVQGLESLIRSLVGAIQNDDTAEEARLLESMRLPDPKAWFNEVFEPRIAERLVAEYEPLAGGIGHLVNALKGPIDAGQTDVKADRFDAPDMQGATGYQQAALAHMKKKVALYSVRLSTKDGKRTFHVWSFVHQDGTFRLVGKMRNVEDKPPAMVGGRDPLEYRVIDRQRVKQATGGGK